MEHAPGRRRRFRGRLGSRKGALEGERGGVVKQAGHEGRESLQWQYESADAAKLARPFPCVGVVHLRQGLVQHHEPAPQDQSRLLDRNPVLSPVEGPDQSGPGFLVEIKSHRKRVGTVRIESEGLRVARIAFLADVERAGAGEVDQRVTRIRSQQLPIEVGEVPVGIRVGMFIRARPPADRCAPCAERAPPASSSPCWRPP